MDIERFSVAAYTGELDVLLNRIDAIVLEVNNNTEVRKNTIKILKGTPNQKNPIKPKMAKG